MRHSRLHITLLHSSVDNSRVLATDAVFLVGLHTNVTCLPPPLLRDCQEKDISCATHWWLMREHRRPEGRAFRLRRVSALQHRKADRSWVSGTIIDDVISFMTISMMKQQRTRNDKQNRAFSFLGKSVKNIYSGAKKGSIFFMGFLLSRCFCLTMVVFFLCLHIKASPPPQRSVCRHWHVRLDGRSFWHQSSFSWKRTKKTKTKHSTEARHVHKVPLTKPELFSVTLDSIHQPCLLFTSCLSFF